MRNRVNKSETVHTKGPHHMTDDKIHGLANISTMSGAAISGIGALTLSQWLAIGGFVLAFAGFIVNAWHKASMVRLRRREVDALVQRQVSDLQTHPEGERNLL